MNALIYEEREEEVEEKDVKTVLTEMEVGLESLIRKHGFKKVMDTVARMSQK